MHQHGRSFARCSVIFAQCLGHTGGSDAYDVISHRSNGALKQLNICFVLAQPVEERRSQAAVM
jgi:hypothetical protein